jgi:aminoglycoside phosphotransferase (APT) family kinase protein
MGSAHEGNHGDVAAVRESHRFDEGRLAEWMTRNIPGYAGPLRVEQFKGGQSNPTYKLVTPDRCYVMRRKPPGQLHKGAHAVDREARVIRALEGTGFPVAHVHGSCNDDSVIGTWFYVMECVDGRILWNGTLPGMTATERLAHYGALNAVIAQLHGIDYRAIGLGDYGRPGNYVERQITRWTQQYLADIPEAGRDPNLDRLIEWLPSNIPPGDETAIVHGDYRLDNLIFHPTEARILAVVDWELSTLGHPLADFAYHLLAWRLPASILSGLSSVDFAALRIPTEEDYVAAYCNRTGRKAIPHLEYFIAFNMFRFAAIVHGIKARAVRGTASSPHALDLVASLPLIAEIAWRQTKGGAAQ